MSAEIVLRAMGRVALHKVRVMPSLAVALAGVLLTAVTQAAEPGDGPAPPAGPAFFTVSIGRVRNIQAESFDFVRDDQKRVCVRLVGADSSKMPDRIRGIAETILRNVLQAEPVWVFPCGHVKGKSDEMWGCVWTTKGWLSEVLIRADYAMRRTDLDLASLERCETTDSATKGQPPCSPAFVAASCKPVDDETYEVDRGGTAVRVRLFDVTCAGADTPTAAAGAAEKCVGGGPVWVFPCGPQKRGQDMRARIWTAGGWISAALLKQDLAKRYTDPYKAQVETASADPTTKPVDPKPKSRTVSPRPRTKSRDPQPLKWTPVSISAAKVARGGMQGAETRTFAVPAPGIWRVTWKCEPPKAGFRVMLNVYRVDDKWQTRVSSHHVVTLKGLTGQRVLQTPPGTYWIKLVCSDDWDGITVELGEPAE